MQLGMKTVGQYLGWRTRDGCVGTPFLPPIISLPTELFLTEMSVFNYPMQESLLCKTMPQF